MTSIFVFICGAALLIYSAEKLIGYLVGVASGLRISLFLLAIVFTGIEFDDITLGVALNVEDLGNVALGIVLGTAVAFTGVVLALAAILTPAKVRIPRDYLLIFGAAPLVMVVFTLMAPLTTVDGLVLLGLFGLFLAYVAVRESRGGVPVFRDAEMYEMYALAGTAASDTAPAPETRGPRRDVERAGGEAAQGFLADIPFARPRKRSGWADLGLAVLALAGLLIGGAATGIGTKGILHIFGLEGTVFGATIATLVLTIEDVFLTVEPTRKGIPEVGVGNVIGSLVFSVTGKLGITLLAGGIAVGPNVLTWHLPALIVLTGLAAYFLSTGRLRRWHGCVLLGLYVVYWVVTFVVFGVAPVDLS